MGRAATRSAPGRRRRRGRRGVWARLVLPAALALAALQGCAAPEAGGAPASRLGKITFVAEPLAPPAQGSNTFDVQLSWRESGEPVEGVALRASAMMPSMGHQPTDEPRVEETGPGLYEVSGVVFSMPGLWEVRYRAVGSSLLDEAAFQYRVE
ncbi:uncharacterized protein SOCE26_036460 [Sorangium cellulosum]|uniref:YtkA-like domain-containing protein n=1 Tax=Sorangium cellulosum TaxID=56 RepID=A0A2L0ESF2_SORCE|nr:uncharacterized protein SOCE26_036460 [Sorangium cellulosum]